MEFTVISLLLLFIGTGAVVNQTNDQDEVSTLPTLGPDADRITDLGVVEGLPASKTIATSAKTFVELITDGNIFIDKTIMMRELFHKRFDGHSHLKIFARPKGWGKSVFLQMIKSFCEIIINEKTKFLVHANRTDSYRLFHRGEITVNGEVRRLQHPLLITKYPELLEKHLSQHPVVYMSFEDLKPKNFDEFKTGVANKFREAFKKFDFNYVASRLGSESNRVEVLCKSIESGDYDWPSFSYLCMTLQQFFLRKMVILIDDYDEPLLQVLNEPSIENKKELVIEIMDFYRSFFKQIDADRTTYWRAIITGTTRIMFDNMLMARDLYDEAEGAYFVHLGFTEHEIGLIFDHLDLPMLSRIQAKNHYGGYQMTSVESKTFVPSSIAKFVSTEKLGNYWTPNEALDGVFDKFLREIHKFRRDIIDICDTPFNDNPPYACTSLRGEYIDDDKIEVLCDFLDGRVEIKDDSYPLYMVLDMAQHLFSSSGHLTRVAQIPNEEVRAFIKRKLYPKSGV